MTDTNHSQQSIAIAEREELGADGRIASIGIVPDVALIVTANPMEIGYSDAPAILRDAERALGETGLNAAISAIVTDEKAARRLGSSAQGIDALCVVAGTWSEDYLVQDVLAHMQAPVPVIAWAMPGMHTGSLCSTHQLCSVLGEIGYQSRFVYGGLSDESARRKASAFALAAAAARRLKGTRVARFGGRTDGMGDVTVDELELRGLLGVRVVERSVEWLKTQARMVDGTDAELVWRGLQGQVGKVGVRDEDGIVAMRYYLALRDFLLSQEITAFTVACYPDMMGLVCLPISLLAQNHGIVGACEGDVNGAIGMRVLAWLTQKPVHNTDLLADDPDRNTIVFSHCGSSAFCLAKSREEIALESCRLAGVGVTAHYAGRPGRVTLINLIGRRGTYRLGVATGDAVPTEMVFPGNPVKVRLDVPIGRFLEDIPEMGLGHHWMIGEGDCSQALVDLAKLLGISVCQPGKRI